MKDIRSILKKFIFFLVVTLFLETVFAVLVFHSIKLDSFVNVFLYSILVAAFLSLITGFFKEKGNTIVTAIILFIMGVLVAIQLVFYNVFKAFVSLSILGLGDQLNSFMGETIKAIIDNIFYIILLLLPFIVYLIFKKKLAFKRNSLNHYVFYIIVLLGSLLIYIIHINSTKDIENGPYALYHNINNIVLNMEKLGVNNSYLLDIVRAITGFDEEITTEVSTTKEEKVKEIVYEKNILDIDFTKATNNKDIKTINNYMTNISGTSKNKYTGMFKGYNLVYVVAESFSNIAISEELTPTLYKLTHSGFVFDNYYTPNTLSTIGGEFQALTGLYPDSSILSKWRTGKNYFPYGLSTVYKSLGYKTFAYHNNSYNFQDRNKYLKSQGFTNYLACWNGIEKRMNCRTWPQSDVEMMKSTMKDYINSEESFLAYYMTVSGHFSYNFSDNSMAYKNKKYVNNLKVSTAAKAYVATQIELDRALEYLIKTLEENGKLDNTVIVLLADHYPYKLSLNDVNSLSSYKRDSVVEINHNALILWNNKMEEVHISKPCMSSDVIPTIYNLFGIDYDSRLFTGEDILSTNDGIAIMGNRSWVTDKGTYFANTGKFVPKVGIEVESDYVKSINNIVKNRLSIAKLIIKNDYYKYLMK